MTFFTLLTMAALFIAILTAVGVFIGLERTSQTKPTPSTKPVSGALHHVNTNNSRLSRGSELFNLSSGNKSNI